MTFKSFCGTFFFNSLAGWWTGEAIRAANGNAHFSGLNGWPFVIMNGLIAIAFLVTAARIFFNEGNSKD